MADSGTLLLCSVDRSGNLAPLRARLKAAFPGAPSTQGSIMHASIGRILSTEQLTVAEIERVQVGGVRQRMGGQHTWRAGCLLKCPSLFVSLWPSGIWQLAGQHAITAGAHVHSV